MIEPERVLAVFAIGEKERKVACSDEVYGRTNMFFWLLLRNGSVDCLHIVIHLYYLSNTSGS